MMVVDVLGVEVVEYESLFQRDDEDDDDGFAVE
eukprot:CAMPEP_0194040898 /NCGR_PEP_ID=MMETSP0009_2-20130614/12832_1 /TAXON_ID=210454 /ORGANISM="Grammatophora oceanica, Strain CCMP 410" /LENGTH=32 /DNA_ID= /DNA_START= /DNA_END= /DNA_ORIENTATION=